MNVLVGKSKSGVKTPYFYEGMWAKNKKETKYDDANIKFKYPKERKNPWKSQKLFLKKLEKIEKRLDQEKKYISYKKKLNCLLCDEKKIATKLYRFSLVNWDNGLSHYVEKHNHKPTIEFMDFIYSNYLKYSDDKIKLSSLSYEKTNTTEKNTKGKKKKFLKIGKNQLLIMDALYNSGGFSKRYYDKKNKINRFSEHAGLLEFKNGKLDKVNILTSTDRTDPRDKEIFLPRNTTDAYNHSYIFHTHPATPSIGGRAVNGILYEFPSVDDIFHYVEHYTDGETKGSIVIAPEGLYMVKKINIKNPYEPKELDKLYKEKTSIHSKIIEIQDLAIEKYPPPYDEHYFFEIIAQDKKYITLVGKVLRHYDLEILYNPRVKNQNEEWVLDTFYIPR